MPDAAELKVFAIRDKHNHESVVAFAGAVAVLGLLCIVFHHVRRLETRRVFSSSAVRKVSAALIQKSPFLPSYSHALGISLYIAIMVAIAFTNLDNSHSPMTANLASRLGWLTVANLAVVVLLALKNAPLASLGPFSHERLNVFHRVAGSCTVICVICHASLYSGHFVSLGRASFLLQPKEVMGMVAGLSLLMIGVSGAIVRNWWYEIFYVMHVTFWIVAVIALGFHQPVMAEKIVYITISVGSVWALDRVIRFTKLLLYSANNEATLTPLPNGATRVTLKKAPMGTVAGKHCYLWLPSLSMLQTHPFTIASTGPLEFVIRSRGGFTAKLYKHALANPNTVVRASVDGPYGSFPDPKRYDKVIFAAGGSGASFIFGTAMAMLDKLERTEEKKIVFVWAVREYSCLDWYSEQIRTLLSDSRVSLKLYVTSSVRMSPPLTPISEKDEKKDGTAVNAEAITEKETQQLHVRRTDRSSDSKSSVIGPANSRDFATYGSGTVVHGKPDVRELIKRETQEMSRHEKILVMACGPEGMQNDARKGTAESMRGEGEAGTELYCEAFG